MQVNVSAITDSTLATFCESYESAHSQHDLTAGIAEVSWGNGQPCYIIQAIGGSALEVASGASGVSFSLPKGSLLTEL